MHGGALRPIWLVVGTGISQMNGMQWIGSSILFTLTATAVVFIFMGGRKRLV